MVFEADRAELSDQRNSVRGMSAYLFRLRRRISAGWLRLERPASLQGRVARNVLLSFLIAVLLGSAALTLDPRTGPVLSFEDLAALGAGGEAVWSDVSTVLSPSNLAVALFIGAVLSQIGRAAWVGRALEAALDLLPGVCLFVGIGAWLMLPALIADLPWLLALGLAAGASYIAGYLKEFGQATRTLADGEAVLTGRLNALNARARELARLARRKAKGRPRRWKLVAWYGAVCGLPAVGVSLVSLASTGQPIAAEVTFWSALTCSLVTALVISIGFRWSEDGIRVVPHLTGGFLASTVPWLTIIQTLVGIGAFGPGARTGSMPSMLFVVLASLGLTLLPLFARLPFRDSIFLRATRWANQRDLQQQQRELEQRGSRLAERRQASLKARCHGVRRSIRGSCYGRHHAWPSRPGRPDVPNKGPVLE